jgi:peroxiredoxin
MSVPGVRPIKDSINDMISPRKALLAIIVIAAVGAAIFAAFERPSPAPLVVFTSITGERLASADLRGQVVLVNFWATDCAVCIREMPELVRTYGAFRHRGLELIAVAMRYDPPNYVIGFAEKNALPFKVALDPMGELARAFGDVRLTPTTFLIDRRGYIVRRILGEPDFEQLHELIERKLAERA